MRTTIEIPADLLRSLKSRADSEGRSLGELVVEALYRGLSDDHRGPSARVKAPFIQPQDELTPDRVADILLDQEVQAVSDAAGPAKGSA